MCVNLKTITDKMLDGKVASIESETLHPAPDCDFCHCVTPLHWPILETCTSTPSVENRNDDEP